AGGAVRLPVVAKGRALARDAHLERVANAGVHASDLCRGERAGLATRMELRAPQRLVGVDVPEPGDGALVEERGLERRASPDEAVAEDAGGEALLERLRAEADGEIRLDLVRFEQQPRAEAADVPVRDVRSVVQTDNGASVRILLEPSVGRRRAERSRHPEVHQKR